MLWISVRALLLAFFALALPLRLSADCFSFTEDSDFALDFSLSPGLTGFFFGFLQAFVSLDCFGRLVVSDSSGSVI